MNPNSDSGMRGGQPNGRQRPYRPAPGQGNPNAPQGYRPPASRGQMPHSSAQPREPFAPVRPANSRAGRPPQGDVQHQRYPRPGEAYPSRPSTPQGRRPEAAGPNSRAPYHGGPSYDFPASSKHPQHGARPGKASSAKNSKGKGGKKGGVPRAVLIVLDLLIVAVLAAAAYFFIKPIYVQNQVEKIKADINQQLKDNPHQVVQMNIPKDFGAVFGERIEDAPEGLTFIDNDADKPDQDTVTLTYVGRMVIPKIGVNVPVSEDSGLMPSIRFGVGINTDFANLLEPGLTNIFGHRYLKKGRDFNLLNEIVPGDVFYIDYNVDGMRHNYKVFKVDIIDDDDIYSRVYEHFDEKTLMLITCHPPTYGDSSQRLLVYAHPEPEKDGPIPTGP